MKHYVLIALFLLSTLLLSCKKDEVKKDEEYKIVTINSDWFKVTYLEPKVYVIEEPKGSQGNVSYLIIGNEKAIMFDTGSGENEPSDGSKIKHIINQLTDLPVSLLLSHFHFDHNQNISEFDYIIFPDLPFLRQNVSADDIYSFTASDLFLGNYPTDVGVDEWYSVNTDIDLGNRVIKLLNIPGHTKESVAIIDQTNKLAFLGDFIYNGALFVFDNADLIEYKESVDLLLAELGADYRLFGAHGVPEVSYSKLQTLKDFLLCIENSTCLPESTTLWGYDVLLYSYEDMQIVVFK